MWRNLLPGLEHLQNLHPVAVHLPLALLPAATLFFFLAACSGRSALAEAGFWTLLLGTLSALAAAVTGWRAAQGVMLAFSVKDQLLHPHKLWMLAATASSVGLSLWALAARPFPRRGRLVFLLLAALLVGILTKGADFGGRMVYDYNAGGNACSQPIEFSK